MNCAACDHANSTTARFCESCGARACTDRAEKLRSRPNERPVIIGGADEVREIVRAYRDAGVDELIVPDFTLGARVQKLATRGRFMHEVAAKLS